MKKIVATLCLVGSTVALSACDTTDMGYVDTAPPYTQERTATYDSEMMAAPEAMTSGERVFQRAQTK